jgi:hypothetical protein
VDLDVGVDHVKVAFRDVVMDGYDWLGSLWGCVGVWACGCMGCVGGCVHVCR